MSSNDSNLELIQLKNLLIFGEGKVLKSDCSDIKKLIKGTQTPYSKLNIQQTVYTTDSQDILNDDCFLKFEDVVTDLEVGTKLIKLLIKMDEDKLDNSINSIDSIKNFYNIKYPYLNDLINLNQMYNKILIDEYQNILDKLTNTRISQGDISYDYITHIYKSDLEKIKFSDEDRGELDWQMNKKEKEEKLREQDEKFIEYCKQLREGFFPINDNLPPEYRELIQNELNKISEEASEKLTEIYTLYKNNNNIPDILLGLLYYLWSNTTPDHNTDYNYIFGGSDIQTSDLSNMIKSYTKVFEKLKEQYSNTQIKWIGKDQYDSIFTRISLIIEKENDD